MTSQGELKVHFFLGKETQRNWVYSTITKHTARSLGSKPRALYSSVKPPRTLIASLIAAVPPLLFTGKSTGGT